MPADIQTPRRGEVLGRGLTWLATWSLRVLLVAGAAFVLRLALAQIWSVVLPALLALLLASVLWRPVAFLRRHGTPPALAALAVLLVFLGVLIGGIALLAPSVTDQVGDIAAQAGKGLTKLEQFVTGPPFNLRDGQVAAAVSTIVTRLQSSATALAATLVSTLATVGTLLVTLALTLALTFFYLKDGPRFLPWLTRVVGPGTGRHLDAVLTRSWSTLGSFVLGQAAVGFVDAVFIGLGLVLLGIPLALPLAVLTFFGAFVPIVGAFTVGGLSVLVALVTKGVTTALIMLAIIVVVQQLEGNVIHPAVQSRNLQLHPGVVIVAVAAGGGLYGIAGAFLAVPLVAVSAVVLRYLSDLTDAETDAARAPADVPDERVPGDEGAHPDTDDVVRPRSPDDPAAEPAADRQEVPAR